MHRIAVVGAGLVGSLLSVYLARRGHKVDVYEKRPDMRKGGVSAGRSINLALSTRGWTALDGVGLSDSIRDIAIPMRGRMIHNRDGSTAFQPYGKEGQAIYSVSRGELNKVLMSAAEAHELVDFHFNHKCVKLNFKEGKLLFSDMEKDVIEEVDPNFIFGADGAFSRVRYGMQKTSRFNYSQTHLEHGYKELTIPPGEEGSHRIEREALHIWPRRSFMLIALPNLDGSFTCTLFAPFQGEHAFEQWKDRHAVQRFFEEEFRDAVPHMPTLLEDFFDNPTSSLVTVRCYPWVHQRTTLIGDASHAIVPFYGQGMNSGFEDCRVMEECLGSDPDGWDADLHRFQELRKPDADAIADLALQNFIEMRDSVADPKFLLRKRVERYLADAHPGEFIPLYSQVTFGNKRYSEAYELGLRQKALLDRIMAINGLNLEDGLSEIEACYNSWLEAKPEELNA